MDGYRETTEAEDARHDTPPYGAMGMPDEGIPMGFELPERGKGQAYRPGSYVEQTTMTWGLQFLDNGRVFSDLGRWSKRTELDDIDTLDLRVILAHLDSAAMAIKAALDQRYGR